MKQIAIIPARGGSKRLPRKNILPIVGSPMITYPIKAAVNSKLFDAVIVSTEDDEIAQIAKHAGARIKNRPKELASDRATVVDVCRHVLSQNEYENVDRFCCIYATAAFLTEDDLSKSRALMDESPNADFIMGVSRYNYHPVQALKSDGQFLTSMWPKFKSMQSQSYPDLVVSNGTLYWARTSAFIRQMSFYGERLKGYEVPAKNAIDIDTPEDYEFACLLANARS